MGTRVDGGPIEPQQRPKFVRDLAFRRQRHTRLENRKRRNARVESCHYLAAYEIMRVEQSPSQMPVAPHNRNEHVSSRELSVQALHEIFGSPNLEQVEKHVIASKGISQRTVDSACEHQVSTSVRNEDSS